MNRTDKGKILRFRLFFSPSKDGKNQKEENRMKNIYSSVEEYEKNCYLFAPSVSKRKTVGGKSYYVRRYFKGGKDFERTMERLAVNQANKAAR